MPLLDLNDPTLWDGGPTSLYRDGFGRGYVREAKEAFLGNDHHVLREVLNIQPQQPIVLVGSGFGWVAEDWEEAGLGPILCLDTSRYIQANKDKHARLPILDRDVGDVNLREVLSNGERSHWCISEDVVSVLTDQEAVELAQRMSHIASRVVHWVSCGIRVHDDPAKWAGDERLNWKTLEEWKELLAPDTVVGRNEHGRML